MTHDTCDRCGSDATCVMPSDEAYCRHCHRWRIDLALEACGINTGDSDNENTAETREAGGT